MIKQGTLKFIIIAAGFVLTQFSLILYLPSQPQIAHDLGLSDQSISYALSTALAGYALGQLFWGTISDSIGRKKALLTACAGGAIAAALIPYCLDIVCFNLGMALLTFCQAAYTSIGYALIRESFPIHKTGRIIASIGVLMAITPVVGPSMNHAITSSWGWHWIFWGLSIYSICLLLIFSVNLKPNHSKESSPISKTQFKKLYKNKDFINFCLSLALGFSCFITFQQYAKPLFAYLFNTNSDSYSYFYALATAPYLLSTAMVRKCLGHFTPAKMLRCGLLLLSGGYGLILLPIIFPSAPFAYLYAWVGIAVTMIATGIIMPVCKIGAISSVTDNVGTAGSVMKFTQIGISIVITWLAATITSSDNPSALLWLLMACAITATIINFTSRRSYASVEAAQ